MIKAVRCDKPSFKTVHFKPGFNVVLAERTQVSTDRDSRNGLGKSTLIEIIHFCLGSSTRPNEGLRVPELHDWTFTLELILRGKEFAVSRNTARFGYITIEGDTSGWPIQPEYDDNTRSYILSVKDWNLCLGYLMFELEPEKALQKYAPSFRSLISYFARRGTLAFNDPFKHYPQQKTWDIQVNNAFLLGLNWEYAAQFQILKDKEKTLRELKKAAHQGLLKGFIGTIGELEAERIILQERIRETEKQLKNFEVHPQYTEIQQQANRLTAQIHAIVNQQTVSKRLLERYKESIREEKEVPVEDVMTVYHKAGIMFKDDIQKKLEEVLTFHQEVVRNRKSYLENEINRLQKEIEKQSVEIEQLSEERAKHLSILKTHGALEEYTTLQSRYSELKQELTDIESRIENLQKFESGMSDLKIEREELLQRTRRDFSERRELVDKDRLLFSKNSGYLYREPGILSIDLNEMGYRFDIEIKRTRSQGISYMKVFCYDLTLAQLQADKPVSPGFLIHDNTIFNGVDERQIARALELAARESATTGFQYIVTLNSDQVPYGDFKEGFKGEFDNSLVLKLTDATENGGLLGMRW